MKCPLCTEKLTRESARFLSKACDPCQRQVKQLLAGFRGVMLESKAPKYTWDNTKGYMEWVGNLEETDADVVNLKKNSEYVEQRCDIRDMKHIVGLPEFLPLESQVYTAWIVEGVKDEKIQEVLGLTYSQLFHVKSVIRTKLQRKMAEYQKVKKLARRV